jgi:hypothetical protein
VNEIGAHRLTPIVTAAGCCLAKHGAGLNMGAGVNGWTPLMRAIHKNQIESVWARLDDGAASTYGAGKWALR